MQLANESLLVSPNYTNDSNIFKRINYEVSYRISIHRVLRFLSFAK